MTAEEYALKQFQDEPFFEVLVQSISRKATAYAYAKLQCNKTLGSGNALDCLIRETVFKSIEKFQSK